MAGAAPQELVAEVERRLEQVDEIADPEAHEVAAGLVQCLVDLYGTGLERIVEALAARDEDGALAAALAGDELVSHLLLLHGLHPVGVEQRVRDALAEVRPYLESHGGDVQLLAIEHGIVRLRLAGSCHGCPSSAMTLKLAIEDAVHRRAPEIEEVVAESPPSDDGLLQIELAPALAAPTANPPVEGSWEVVGSLPDLAPGRPAIRRVAGEPILFLRLEQRTYAYGGGCPACGDALSGASLQETTLVCPGCGHHYDVIRAGRCLDAPQLQLEPVPLLVGEDGLVRVAVKAAA